MKGVTYSLESFLGPARPQRTCPSPGGSWPVVLGCQQVEGVGREEACGQGPSARNPRPPWSQRPGGAEGSEQLARICPQLRHSSFRSQLVTR